MGRTVSDDIVAVLHRSICCCPLSDSAMIYKQIAYFTLQSDSRRGLIRVSASLLVQDGLGHQLQQ
eukprot:4214674-Amphidinium_carterae.1